jgi:hypothetical protein
MNRLEIEIGDTVRIAETSKYYKHGVNNPTCEGVYNKDDGCSSLSHRVDWANGMSEWYNLHDLTLIKKGKTVEFTKSDLKTGMFVKQRDGTYSIFINDTLSEINTYMELGTYDNSLKHNRNSRYDIVSVYQAGEQRGMSTYLEGKDLTPIWERTEQTEAQKEMEVLQQQAKALQEQITKLQGKL